MMQYVKRLHFHNPPAPDQKTAASELPSLRAVTENNFEPPDMVAQKTSLATKLPTKLPTELPTLIPMQKTTLKATEK